MTDKERAEIVAYRMENASNTLKEVMDHCENGYYNTAVNRLYYACYYATSALLVANGIITKSHNGVRQQLGKEFVLTGKLSPEMGRFYSYAFSKRSAGDYEDFINHTEDTVREMYPKALEFIDAIKGLLNI